MHAQRPIQGGGWSCMCGGACKRSTHPACIHRQLKASQITTSQAPGALTHALLPLPATASVPPPALPHQANTAPVSVSASVCAEPAATALTTSPFRLPFTGRGCCQSGWVPLPSLPFLQASSRATQACTWAGAVRRGGHSPLPSCQRSSRTQQGWADIKGGQAGRRHRPARAPAVAAAIGQSRHAVLAAGSDVLQQLPDEWLHRLGSGHRPGGRRRNAALPCNPPSPPAHRPPATASVKAGMRCPSRRCLSGCICTCRHHIVAARGACVLAAPTARGHRSASGRCAGGPKHAPGRSLTQRSSLLTMPVVTPGHQAARACQTDQGVRPTARHLLHGLRHAQPEHLQLLLLPLLVAGVAAS